MATLDGWLELAKGTVLAEPPDLVVTDLDDLAARLLA